MIPATSGDAIIAAMTRFDTDLRGTPDWDGWEHAHPHKYAVLYEGRQYPVKQIISMATNISHSSFKGGDESKSYLQTYGFSVVPLQNDTWQGKLSEWLNSNPRQMPAHLRQLREAFVQKFPKEHLGELT